MSAIGSQNPPMCRATAPESIGDGIYAEPSTHEKGKPTLLYRLVPPSQVTWCDIPSRGTIQVARENNVDLVRLPWEPAEARAFSSELLRLALRYGVPCGDGIVVSAIDVVDLGRSDELRLLNHQSTEAHSKLRDEHAFMEQLLPGWTARGEELDRQISESMERVAQDTDDDLAEQLAPAPKPALVDHWSRLGGDLPDPL